MYVFASVERGGGVEAVSVLTKQTVAVRLKQFRAGEGDGSEIWSVGQWLCKCAVLQEMVTLVAITLP